MAATFGSLNNQTLELHDGLNLLQAPNESGKSTWCAFLSAMLYGISSRERDKAGYLADKNRFAPWNGASMQGRMDCQIDGIGEITLLRETKSVRSPMGEFRAFYTGTGEPVPGLTGPTCGETLLAVPREVFERSAFIRQAGLGITQDAELEKRIASLITTGEEETSYSEAREVLKRQLNRRQYNKNGQIPAAETELTGIQRQLDHLRAQQTDLSSVQEQLEQLKVQQAELEQALKLWTQYERVQKRKALQTSEQAAAQAKQAFDALEQRIKEEQVPENDTIARLRAAIFNLETVRKSVEKAREQRDELQKKLLRAEVAVQETPFTGRTAEEAQREAQTAAKLHCHMTPAMILSAVGVAGCILLSATLFVALANRPDGIDLFAGLGILALGVAGGLLFRGLYLRAQKNARATVLTNRYGTADISEISALSDAYADLCQKRDEARTAASAASATADSLYASLSSNEQGILLEVRRFAPAAFDISAADQALRSSAVRRKELSDAQSAAKEALLRYELQAQQVPDCTPLKPEDLTLAPPSLSREALTSELDHVRGALVSCQSRADQLAGQIAATGDPAELTARADQLQTEIAGLKCEYASISLAMTALDHSNSVLQSRFSPQLGKRAAEIFSELTGGRYDGVVLNRTFQLSVEPAGDPIYRDAQFLSAGALDQLYLSVRLAICELVLPQERHAPMILDDALANFDDGRCAAALQWLRREAEQRQILLFTCHTREAEYFRGDPAVLIQELTALPF